MAELEELIESYRTFATSLTLSTSVERATRRKLVARKPVIRLLRQRQTPEGREKSRFSWTRRRQTILSLLPNPRCQKTHDAYVLSARTPSPPSLLIPLRMDLKSGWVG
jgi:hypothetical protein